MAGIRDNPAVPPEVRQQAQVELSSGVSFLADADAEAALEQTGVDRKTAAAIVDENATARLGALAAALNRTAIVAAAALFMAGTIPARHRERRRLTPSGAHRTSTAVPA